VGSQASEGAEFALAGIVLTAIVGVCLSVGYALYGGLLVYALWRDKKAETVKKLFFVALVFALAFIGQSVILLLTAVDESRFVSNFDTFNGLYFGLDCVCLAAVLLLFKNNVARLLRQSRLTSGSGGYKKKTASSGTSSHKNTIDNKSAWSNTKTRASINSVTTTGSYLSVVSRMLIVHVYTCMQPIPPLGAGVEAALERGTRALVVLNALLFMLDHCLSSLFSSLLVLEPSRVCYRAVS
jgi:hypothetical protein